MKPLLQKVTLLRLAVIVILTAMCCSDCKKQTKDPTPPQTTTSVDNTTKINLIGLKSDSGFCYKIGYDLNEIGDSQEQPQKSTLRLFENGVELGPAHSNHDDIRKYGLGQFSHWGNTLYFSTSDNSNPLTNGRKYSYSMN